MLDAVPKQDGNDGNEQPGPQPETSLSNERPAVDALPHCAIDLPGVTPAGDCGEQIDNEESDHDLLHQLSASAIESCRGTDLAEPRCRLHVLGFKNPEMESTYLAVHAPTVLTGHRLLAVANAFYLAIRVGNLVRGVNYLDTSILTSFFLCTCGVVAVLCGSCSFYFAGQEVRHRQSLSRVSIVIGAMALCGWLAQYIDMFFFQTHWETSINDVFHNAYFVGALSSMGPSFCLVMLRIPFHCCAVAHLAFGILVLCTSYAAKQHISTFVAMPLLQVSQCLS